jgi:flavin reductase (DIM6/NTAB) family NADH-FMN oxidoreductase RutF
MPTEQADPAQDARAFRRSLGQYPTGVTVIAARDGEQLLGMAVNSFAAVSLDPPLVLWSIRRESRSAQAFLRAARFSISILADNQIEVAQLFGAGAPDRFNRVEWQAGLGGAPLICGAIAHIECCLETTHDGGDHHVLVGRVLRHARLPGEPLVFAQGQYAVTANHPHLATTTSTDRAPSNADAVVPQGFLRLLSLASQRLSSSFQVHRDALDLSPAMARVLAVLQSCASTPEALEHATCLGRMSLDDALVRLRAQGLIHSTPGGHHQLTTAGLNRREALAMRSDQFTQEKLQGASPADIEAARRVMALLQDP